MLATDELQSIDFTQFTILFSTSEVRYIDKASKIENNIAYWTVDAYDSGHYILRYKKPVTYKKYNQVKSVHVFKNKVTEGTYFRGTKFDFKITQVKQRPYYRISSYVTNTKDF